MPDQNWRLNCRGTPFPATQPTWSHPPEDEGRCGPLLLPQRRRDSPRRCGDTLTIFQFSPEDEELQDSSGFSELKLPAVTFSRLVWVDLSIADVLTSLLQLPWQSTRLGAVNNRPVFSQFRRLEGWDQGRQLPCTQLSSVFSCRGLSFLHSQRGEGAP